MKRILLILFLFLTSCEKEFDDGFRVFTINKGEHRSGTYLQNKVNDNAITFQVILDESAIYDFSTPFNPTPQDQHDINKIYGFSDFGQLHQESSIRLGWSYFSYDKGPYKAGELWFRWLRHAWGQHRGGPLMKIETNEVYTVTIRRWLTQYEFIINDSIFLVERDLEQNRMVDWMDSYYLYPYFGGQQKAPHDITIKIKDLPVDRTNRGKKREKLH